MVDQPSSLPPSQRNERLSHTERLALCSAASKKMELAGILSTRLIFLVVSLLCLTSCKSAQHVPAANPRTPVSAPGDSSANSQSSSSNPGRDLKQRLQSLTSGQNSSGATTKPQLPDWKPAAASLKSPDIPLRKGLLVITAIHEDLGDYESFKRISAVTSSQVTLEYSATYPEPVPFGLKPPPGEQKMIHESRTRLIDAKDMVSARTYAEIFGGTHPNPEHFPGSTAISASTEIINQLRANQPIDFHYDNANGDLLGSLSQALLGLGANSTKSSSPNASLSLVGCTLHRVEPTDLVIPVLLNEQPVELPAIHASCTASDQQVDLYYLDSQSNPLTLAFQLGSEKMRLQVIKIAYPITPLGPSLDRDTHRMSGHGSFEGAGGTQMEQQLAEKKPVEIYGIYFDFDSDVIKPDSHPVLDEIAAIMKKNPAWKLSVSGHTDSIGDANFNLGLSLRRATAVKNDLVAHYQINPDRLTTAGYGATRPVADNSSLEGRARNRRVELQRE